MTACVYGPPRSRLLYGCRTAKTSAAKYGESLRDGALGAEGVAFRAYAEELGMGAEIVR
jgi:hypothetical protein